MNVFVFHLDVAVLNLLLEGKVFLTRFFVVVENSKNWEGKEERENEKNNFHAVLEWFSREQKSQSRWKRIFENKNVIEKRINKTRLTCGSMAAKLFLSEHKTF